MRRMAFGLLLIGILLGLPRLAHHFRAVQSPLSPSVSAAPQKTRTEAAAPPAPSPEPPIAIERLPTQQAKNPITAGLPTPPVSPIATPPIAVKPKPNPPNSDDEASYLPPGTKREKTAMAERLPSTPAAVPPARVPPAPKPAAVSPPQTMSQKAAKPVEPKPARLPATSEAPSVKPPHSPPSAPAVAAIPEKSKSESPKPVAASREETPSDDNKYDDIYYPSRYRRSRGRITARVHRSRSRYASIDARPYYRRSGRRLSSSFRTANFSWPGQ